MSTNINGYKQEIHSPYLQQHINHHNPPQQHHQYSQRQESLNQQGHITNVDRNNFLKPSASGKDISNISIQFNNQLNQNQMNQQQQIVHFTAQMLQNQNQAQQNMQNQQIDQQNQKQFKHLNQESQPNKFLHHTVNQAKPEPLQQPLSFHGNEKTLQNYKGSKNQEGRVQSQESKVQNSHKDQIFIDSQKHQHMNQYEGQYSQQKQSNYIQKSYDNTDIINNKQHDQLLIQINDRKEIKYQDDMNEQQQINYNQTVDEFREQYEDEGEEESQEQIYNDDEQSEDTQPVINKVNTGGKQNGNVQNQQTHVEGFKLEIERRFQKSQINQEYTFPKESSITSCDSESSLMSLKNVQIYDLNLQNLPNLSIQNSQYKNQVGSNNLNFKHHKYEQQQQQTQPKQQQEPKPKNMKICLSERNLNSQAENKNQQASFLQNQNNIQNNQMNNRPQLPSSSSSQNKLKNQLANINNTNQSNTSFKQNSFNIAQKSQQNSFNPQSKTLKKNEQTKSFSDLRATSANTNSNQNTLEVLQKTQGNTQITQHMTQNENSQSLRRLQNNNQKQHEQLNNEKQTQHQQIYSILQNSNKNLNNLNSNENQLRTTNFSPQQAGNSYYLTERWKKDPNEYQKTNLSANTQNYNQIIANLSKNLKKQEIKLPDSQFQDNSIGPEQFLNINLLLEKSGHQTLTENLSNNISTNNINYFKQQNQSSSFVNSNTVQINQMTEKKNLIKTNITNDEFTQFNQKINSQDVFQNDQLMNHKTLNLDNRSRQQCDTELQNRIMKMKQNLDEKLRQSTSRSNDRTNNSQYLCQKPQQQCQDIFQKMKSIIQNDTTGNQSSQSCRNTQRKDKNDNSKNFETKKGVSNHLQTNLNISANNINNMNQNGNQQQNYKGIKEQNQKTMNTNYSQPRLDRNSSTKYLTNKSQSKEKLQSNTKQPTSQIQSNINLSQNQLPSSNRLTITNLQTPQSHANKQIPQIINSEQGYINLDSFQQGVVLEQQALLNSHSKNQIKQKIIQNQQQQSKQNVSLTPQNGDNITYNNSNNGTTTVTTTTTNASNTNSTINPQMCLIQSQKNSQCIQQQIQNTISGLKLCLNNKKESNSQKTQPQLAINQVIQKQQEQIQQNKMTSYKSSGNLLKNYSNSNLKVQTSRNQPKSNIRDVRLKLNEEGQTRVNNCQSEIQNNNSFHKKDISKTGTFKNNANFINIGQTLQTQESQKNLFSSSQKSNNNFIQELSSSQNNTINKSLINCLSESNIHSNIQKQSQQTATNTSRIQNTSREREVGYSNIQSSQLQQQINLTLQPQLFSNQQNSNFGQNGLQQQQLSLQMQPSNISPSSNAQQIQQSSSNKQNTIQLKNLLQQQQIQTGQPTQSLSLQNRTNKEDSSTNNKTSNNGNLNTSNFIYQKSPINNQSNKGSQFMNQMQIQNQNYINNKSPSKLSINQVTNYIKETQSPLNQNQITCQDNINIQKQDGNQQGQYCQSQSSKTNLLQQIMQKSVKNGLIKNNNYLGEQFNEQEENVGPTNKSIQQYKKAVEISLKVQQSQQQQQLISQSLTKNGSLQKFNNFDPSPLRNISKNHLNYQNKAMNNTSNSHYHYLNISSNNQNSLNMNNSTNNNYLSNNLNGSQNVDISSKLGNSVNYYNNIINSNDIMENNNIQNSNNITNENSSRNNLNKTISVQKNNFMINDNYIKGLTKNFSQKQFTTSNSNQQIQQQKLENKQLLQSTEFNNNKPSMKLKDIAQFCQINQQTSRQQNSLFNSNFNGTMLNAETNRTELNSSQNKCDSQKQLSQSKSYGIYSQEPQSHYQAYLQSTQQQPKQQQLISNYSIQMNKEQQC